MKQTKVIEYGIAILLTASGIANSRAVSIADGQTKSGTKATAGSNQRGRDPFKRYEPPALVVKKMGGVVMPPSIQERIEQYKAQKLAAMSARIAAPKPTTAFLLSEGG